MEFFFFFFSLSPHRVQPTVAPVRQEQVFTPSRKQPCSWLHAPLAHNRCTVNVLLSSTPLSELSTFLGDLSLWLPPVFLSWKKQSWTTVFGTDFLYIYMEQNWKSLADVHRCLDFLYWLYCMWSRFFCDLRSSTWALILQMVFLMVHILWLDTVELNLWPSVWRVWIQLLIPRLFGKALWKRSREFDSLWGANNFLMVGTYL